MSALDNKKYQLLDIKRIMIKHSYYYYFLAKNRTFNILCYIPLFFK